MKEIKNKRPSYRRQIRINGRMISKRFLRKSDADRWYQEALRKKQLVEAGIQDPVFNVTLREFAEDWMRSRVTNGQPFGSNQQEEARLRLYVYPMFGHRVLETITSREWDQFLNATMLKYELAAGTRNRIRSMMSKMYNDAMRLEAASRNPISIIPKSKETMTSWDYWKSHEECSSYLRAAEQFGPSIFIYAYLALNTGARVGELLALEHRDIDLVQRRIRIWRIYEQASHKIQYRTKSFSERWLGISDELFAALTRHREWSKFDSPNSPLICDKDGNRLDQHAIRRNHKNICRKAELRIIRVHDLRHTFASHFIMAGGSLPELQGLLGHSSPVMTLKYAHLAPGYLESRASVVSFSAGTDAQKRVFKIVK